MSAYREDILEFFERKFASDPSIEPGKMMGLPGFKLVHNNKFFLLCYDDGVMLKMPAERYKELLKRDDVVPFQPMGDRKPMSTWIVWTRIEPDEYFEEWEIIELARNYTESEPPNPKRKKKQSGSLND